MVYYSLADRHIENLFYQGLEHAEEEEGKKWVRET